MQKNTMGVWNTNTVIVYHSRIKHWCKLGWVTGYLVSLLWFQQQKLCLWHTQKKCSNSLAFHTQSVNKGHQSQEYNPGSSFDINGYLISLYFFGFQQQKLCLWHTQQKNVRTLWPPYLTSLYWCQREWQANAQQGLEKRSKQERNCN